MCPAAWGTRGLCSTAQTWAPGSPGAALLGSPGYPGLSLKVLLLFEDAKRPHSQCPAFETGEQSWKPAEIKLLCDRRGFVMHGGCRYHCNISYQALSPTRLFGARRQRRSLGKHSARIWGTRLTDHSVALKVENLKPGRLQEWAKDGHLDLLGYPDFLNLGTANFLRLAAV